tara:strand:+ start:1163 stop:2296 length:1134 start_codon:yes stop_codon:yes gene_type:complete
MERDIKIKISRSNVRLMVDKQKKGWGFYASILFKMPMIAKDDVQTMATDGKSIFYNPEWSNNLTDEEMDFVRCHEGMHRVLRHHLRLKGRNSELWNIATDYAINSILKKSGMTMPKDGLYSREYEGMSAEKIYKILEKENSDTRPMPCNWGQVKSGGKEMTEEEIKAEENKIRAEITMGVQQSRNIGELPSDIKQIITEMERSQVDWSSVIRRVVGGDQPEDYTYRRPSRRALHCWNVYNPSTLKSSCGDVAVWVDTSGSVSDKEKQHALGELNAIAEDMQPNSVTIFYGDANVQNIERYERGDTIECLNSKGGGGTDPMPIFKYIEDNNVNVDSMVCITDMEFHNFPSHVDYPLLWVSTNLRAEKPPIGEITFINV